MWIVVILFVVAFLSRTVDGFATITSTATDGMNATLSFTYSGSATSFEVDTGPGRQILLPISSLGFSSGTAPFPLTKGVASNILDTSMFETQAWVSGPTCPYAYLTTASYTCQTLASTATIVDGYAQLLAYPGAIMELSKYMATLSTGPSLTSQVPILSPKSYVPLKPITVEVVMTGWLVANSWLRYSWSGIMLYDVDNRGRIRPFLRYGIYEYSGGIIASIPICSSATSCTWSNVGASPTFGSSNVVCTRTDPCKFRLTYNPDSQSWSGSASNSIYSVSHSNIISYSTMSTMNFWWTNYMNSATYGLFDPAKVRVAAFHENRGLVSAFHGIEVRSIWWDDIVEVPSYPNLFGEETGPNGLTAAGSPSVLDATRFQAHTGLCSLNANTCSSTASTVTLSSGVATLTAQFGHFFNPAFWPSGPTSPSMDSMNGVPMVEFKFNPGSNPAYVYQAVTVGHTQTHNWSRKSFHGLVVYDVDNTGRKRILLKVGFWEWLGQWAVYRMSCSASSCSWSSFASSTIGGSSVVTPSVSAPWKYGLMRNAVEGTWTAVMKHPSYPEYRSTISDDVIISGLGPYFTDYVANPTYGGFSWDNVRVAFAVELETDHTATMGSLLERLYVANALGDILYTAYDTESLQLGQYGACSIASSQKFTFEKANVCIGNSCTLPVPLPQRGVLYQPRVFAISSSGREYAQSTNTVTAQTSLPVSGATLYLDASLLPSFMGSSLRSACVGTGGQCVPMLFWRDLSEKSMLFQQMRTSSSPDLRVRDLDRPYPAMFFNGASDYMTLSLYSNYEDNMKYEFSDQPSFVAGRSIESTWFVVGSVSENAENLEGQTFFAKGGHTVGMNSGGSYQFMAKQPIADPSGQSVTTTKHAGFILSDSNQNGMVATRPMNRATPTGLNYNLTTAPVVYTVVLSSGSYSGSTNRAYTLTVCQGIEKGDNTDRCSTVPNSLWDPTQTPYPLNLDDFKSSTSPARYDRADFGKVTAYNAASKSFPAPKAAFTLGAAQYVTAAGSYLGSFLNGEILALLKYPRALNLAERNTTQTMLHQKFDLVCPAIEQTSSLANGCPESYSGDSCYIGCPAGTFELGGYSSLHCNAGRWVGKMPVCVAHCPSRSSPRDFSTCHKRIINYAFSDVAQFPTDTPYSNLPKFVSISPAGASYRTLNSVWKVHTLPGFSSRALVGRPTFSSATCTDDGSTGPLLLGENNPFYPNNMIAGQGLEIDLRMRLLDPGSVAGIMLRSNGLGGYRLLFGSPTSTVLAPGSRITLERVTTAGVATSLSTVANSNVYPFDVSGSASAQPIRARVNIHLPTATSQNILVRIIPDNGVPVVVLNYTDTLSSAPRLGAHAFVVSSGAAAFELLRASQECERSGNVCNTYSGQACEWSCEAGTRLAVGGIPHAFPTPPQEVCPISGYVPPEQEISCVPLPPTSVTVPSTMEISEAALVGTPVGTITGIPVKPEHKVFFNIVGSGNSETPKDKFGRSLPTVDNVFAIDSCSGTIALIKSNTISYDRGSRSFSLTVQGCTNAHASACVNVTVPITVTNAHSAPYFLADPDSLSETVWGRAIAENSPAGTRLLHPSLHTMNGSAVTAFSPENSPLTYSLSYQSVSNTFAINPLTGIITTVSGSIDYEQTSSYTIVVRATDALGVFADVTVQVTVLDRNDPPVAPSPQYFTISETNALVETLLGELQASDPDRDDSVSFSVVLSSLSNPFSVKVDSASNVSTALLLNKTLTYPSPEILPVIAWRGMYVREVLRGEVLAIDAGGLSVRFLIEVGISSDWTSSGSPVLVSANLPPTAVSGLTGSGGETITFTGRNFNDIRNTYGGIVVGVLEAQQSDLNPGRRYNMTDCRVVDDTSLRCVTSAGWGENLVVSLYYGAGRVPLVAESLLTLSYHLPELVSILAPSPSLPVGLEDIVDPYSLTTAGGQLMAVRAVHIGAPSEASALLALQFTIPNTVPPTVYRAPYTPCPNGAEVFANPDMPGTSTICFITPGGVGRSLTARLTLGYTSSAAITNAVSYVPPTASLVLSAEDYAAGVNATTQPAGPFSAAGGQVVYIVGAGFGPMGTIPRVYFASAAGVQPQLNYSVAALQSGAPDCSKPVAAQAHALLRCVLPPMIGRNLRLQLIVGNSVFMADQDRIGVSISAPVLTGLSGPGSRFASTEGGQALTLTGSNLGVSALDFVKSTSSLYDGTPLQSSTRNANSVINAPVTLTYGPVTGDEITATGCTVASVSSVQCISAPGIGFNFTYKLTVAGQTTSLHVEQSGYAPPLLSSVERAADTPVDPALGRVPTVLEFLSVGGEVIVIRGRNFGPMGSSNINMTYSVQKRIINVQGSQNGEVEGSSGAVTYEKVTYTSPTCTVAVAHTVLHCVTAPGTGTNAVISISVGGQSSLLPSTSFVAPTITSVTLQDASGTPITYASPDGGDILVLKGTNFGPCPSHTIDPVTQQCRGFVTSVTYGFSGVETAAAGWYFPAGFHNSHDTLHVILSPGVGSGLRVVVTVAQQPSLASQMSFSFATPQLIGISPNAGPSEPSEVNPTSITVRGHNLGLAAPGTIVSVLFGNPEDRTLNTDSPIVSVYPNHLNATELAAYRMLPRPREERVTFHMPPSIGRRRAVRLSLRASAQAAPLLSNPVYLDVHDPSITNIVVEAIARYVQNNESLGDTEEYILASQHFATVDVSAIRRITLNGKDFGPSADESSWELVRFVEIASSYNTDPSDPDLQWASSLNPTSVVLFSWSPTRVVALCTVNSAYVRLGHVTRAFGLPESDPNHLLTTRSSPVLFSDLSPSIGEIVGNKDPFGTAGGAIIAFTAKNLLSVAYAIEASLNGRPCPIVYAPDDNSRTPGGVVTNENIVQHLVFNSDGKKPYFDTPAPSVDSVWTLYCRVPPGEGAASSLIVARDGIMSADLRVSYAPPSLSTVTVEHVLSPTPVVVAAGYGVTTFRLPTSGGHIVLEGQNFGVCPFLMYFGRRLYFNSTDSRCSIYEHLMVPGSSASHVRAEMDLPAGEGLRIPVSFTAGDQMPEALGQYLELDFMPAHVTTHTEGGGASGGSLFVAHGESFGQTPPTVTIGGLLCVPPVNTSVSNYDTNKYLECVVPAGSGANLDVTITTAGPQVVTLPGAFSYFTPQISIGEVYNTSDLGLWSRFTDDQPSEDPFAASVVDVNVRYDMEARQLQLVSILEGAPSGGQVVVLRGSNFGEFDLTKNCIFLAWRGRDRARSLRCNQFEDFIGEGEVPLISLHMAVEALEALRTKLLQSNRTEDHDLAATIPEPNPLDTVVWRDDVVAFVVPPGTGIRDLIVLVTGQTPSVPMRLHYDLPTVIGELMPPSGPTIGGTRVVIRGSGFGRPPLDTSTPEGRAAAASMALPQSVEAFFTRALAPQAALSIEFGRGCVSNYLNGNGVAPAFLATCERGVLEHTPSSLAFSSTGGIGLNRAVTVVISDLQPNDLNPDEIEAVFLRSNPASFSYDPPVAVLAAPRPVPMDGKNPVEVTIAGINFGTLTLANLQGWSEAERRVNMSVGGSTEVVHSVERLYVAGTETAATEMLSVRLKPTTVGYHNFSYIVAGQPGFTTADPPSRATIFLSCAAGPQHTHEIDDAGPHGGYFGRVGETCAECPLGAVCLGFDERLGNASNELDPGAHTYPIPVRGFYNMNSTDALSNGMYDECPPEVKAQYPGRDVCIVKCEPADACLGANMCAEEYESVAPFFRCSTCAKGFYKRATQCVRCPESPAGMAVIFALIVVVGGGAAYVLNRMKINIAYVSIAVDYFQVIAIFANTEVEWPAALDNLYQVLSAFNFNLDIVAPECLMGDVSFKDKWYFIMVFPLCLAGLFAVAIMLNSAFKKYFLGQSGGFKSIAPAVMSSILLLMYIMYIYLVRTVLDVFNCRATDPPDGKTYMVAVFDECGKSGGVQMTLMPVAVFALIVYVIGYPVLVCRHLYKNRELIMEDQLLRAKGLGHDRVTNPNAYTFRKRWGRLYYQFKPDYFFWTVVIIIRKFCIAATFILFNREPGFQLAACFLIIFVSYSLQMRYNPYMSPGDLQDVVKDHERSALSSPLHAKLRASLSTVATKTPKRTRRNGLASDINLSSINAGSVVASFFSPKKSSSGRNAANSATTRRIGGIDVSVALTNFVMWLFNYNTVEQLMLFSAGVVTMMGIMFAAQDRKNTYYASSRDAIAAVVILVVIISIIYLVLVFVTDVFTMMKLRALHKGQSSGFFGSASNSQNKLPLKSGTSGAASAKTEEFSVGDLNAMTNPMFLNGSASAGNGGNGTTDDETQSVHTESTMNARSEIPEDISAILESMRDPPATQEQWNSYKWMYESLMENVDKIESLLESNHPSILKAVGYKSQNSEKQLEIENSPMLKFANGQAFTPTLSSSPAPSVGSGFSSVTSSAPSPLVLGSNPLMSQTNTRSTMSRSNSLSEPAAPPSAGSSNPHSRLSTGVRITSPLARSARKASDFD